MNVLDRYCIYVTTKDSDKDPDDIYTKQKIPKNTLTIPLFILINILLFILIKEKVQCPRRPETPVERMLLVSLQSNIHHAELQQEQRRREKLQTEYTKHEEEFSFLAAAINRLWDNTSLLCETLPNEMTDLEQEEMLKDFKKHMNPKIYRCNACGIEGTKRDNYKHGNLALLRSFANGVKQNPHTDSAAINEYCGDPVARMSLGIVAFPWQAGRLLFRPRRTSDTEKLENWSRHHRSFRSSAAVNFWILCNLWFNWSRLFCFTFFFFLLSLFFLLSCHNFIFAALAASSSFLRCLSRRVFRLPKRQKNEK